MHPTLESLRPFGPNPLGRAPLRWPHALALLAAACAFGAQAASPAASSCPSYFFLSDNLALNAGLETPSAGVPPGSDTCWKQGQPLPAPSAATGWTMHSSNQGAKVCSRLVASTAPGAAPGSRMMRFQAGGNEGGILQSIVLPAGHAYMLSAWVKVSRGQVALLVNANNTGPVSWTSKVGEWEQLRVCTNSLGETSLLQIANEDPEGGVFFVDRLELREMPVLE